MEKAQIIQKLTNGSEKSWVKVGSSSDTADRKPGDRKYMFSKKEMTFSIWVCSSILKWECLETYTWSLQYDIETRYTLFVNEKPCSFSFDRTLKFLTLKIYNWQIPITLK